MSPFIDHDLSMSGIYRDDPERARLAITDALKNWSVSEIDGVLRQVRMAFPPLTPEKAPSGYDSDGFELPSPDSLMALLERVGLRLTIIRVEVEPAAPKVLEVPATAQAA